MSLKGMIVKIKSFKGKENPCLFLTSNGQNTLSPLTKSQKGFAILNINCLAR
jgi:hypothetical protein